MWICVGRFSPSMSDTACKVQPFTIVITLICLELNEGTILEQDINIWQSAFVYVWLHNVKICLHI